MKTTMTEHAQIHHGMFLVNFPDQEGHKADDGDNRQGDDLARGKPVEVLAFRRASVAGQRPDHQQHEADPVNRASGEGIGKGSAAAGSRRGRHSRWQWAY